ncbi:TRAP transporter substrate-binding protein DctP [Albimonas sp. CAU 1670]|uniref:TRAP transporter substrate-binding protein DctP n=1 Tax=Albimonas sp. CAU 1670 TaxID=3032599 RepID=UPI0023DA7812|nr:TRAP transporter substrate-binding protein DctP [Albimonas sp. CAU 1670]MDF2235003.1 TRAP transporter substrate-binding protein DctP [Albimonas sp. CAU 1670]
MTGLKSLLTTSAAAVALAATLGAPATAADIAYATHIPSTNVTVEPALKPWAERLAEHDINVNFFWGGTVAKHGAMPPAIRDGLADMGFMADLYGAQDLPNSVLVTNLPLVNLDARVMTAVAAEARMIGCEGCEEELAEFGAFNYNVFSLPSQYLMCREPVANLAQLEGKKVRATGVLGRMLAKWGAVPVAMPVTDGYEALERGQVDCTTGIDTFIMDYSWWDSAKYILDMPLGLFAGVLTMMSESKFESLSEEQQKAMLAERARLAADSAYAYFAEGEKARKLAVEEHGVTFLEPEDDIKAKLEEARIAERDEDLAQSQKLGAKDPEARIANVVALAEKWQKIVDETGGDKEALIEAMEREIYSKVQP